MREMKFRIWYKFNSQMWFNARKFFWIAIDAPEKYVVMQYTGLKDKNGKEIYEGDVMSIPGWTRTKRNKIRKGLEEMDAQLERDYGKYCIVKWEGLFGGFGGKGLAGWQDGKVIGNIYENPELIDN